MEIGKSSDLSLSSWGSNWAAKWATAKVDDVYADNAVIGSMSRAGKIFAGTVKLEKGAMAEQVTYTKEFKTDFNCYFVSEQPKKVETLPPPPF